MSGSPYYKSNGQWIRGLEVQPILPPIVSLVGKYVWLGRKSHTSSNDQLAEGFALELEEGGNQSDFANVKGCLTSISFGGRAQVLMDAANRSYLRLEATEETGNRHYNSSKPGGGFWRLYVGMEKDDHDIPFIGFRHETSQRFAFGKRQIDGEPVQFSEQEKDRINFLLTNEPLLSERIFWRRKADMMPNKNELGSPCYTIGKTTRQGFKPQQPLPSIKDLVGRYAWAETGWEGSLGPRLQEGLIFEVSNSDPGSTDGSIAIVGQLTGLPFGGDLVSATKSLNKQQKTEFWLIKVISQQPTPEQVEDPHIQHEQLWGLYVSAERDDNNNHFISMLLPDNHTTDPSHNCPRGYGKRIIDGQPPSGFTDGEKERIGFITEEVLSRSRNKRTAHEKERRKRREEAMAAAALGELEQKEPEGLIKVGELNGQKGSAIRGDEKVNEENLGVDEWEELERQRVAAEQTNPASMDLDREEASVDIRERLQREEKEIEALEQQFILLHREIYLRRRALEKEKKKADANDRDQARKISLSQPSCQQDLDKVEERLQEIVHSRSDAPLSTAGSLSDAPPLVMVKEEPSDEPGIHIKGEPLEPALTWEESPSIPTIQGLKRARENSNEVTASKRIKREE